MLSQAKQELPGPSQAGAPRSVLHLDLDCFFISVERLKNSALKGKPVIVGGTGGRGVVASCSYETRRFGVHSAMPMKMAQRLCPEAIVIRGDMESYSQYSHLVTEIIADQVPLFEKTSIDEFYADLSGMDRFFGCYRWSSDLRQTIMKESGLPISFGLSVNKLVSKIATGEAKPNGQLHIEQAQKQPFLDPLPVGKIPSVGKVTHRHLSSMGVRHIHTLRQIPLQLLEHEFGKMGRLLWQKAQGEDHSPVVPYNERKSISTERTFQDDTTDVHALKSILTAMTEKLCHQLRSEGKLSACLTVKIRYSDFNTHTLQKQISYTSADHVATQVAHELFDRLYDRRLLVRLIGLRFSKLIQGHYQIDLFRDTQKMLNLYEAMDKIKAKHGKGAVMKAAGFGAKVRSAPEIHPYIKGKE